MKHDRLQRKMPERKRVVVLLPTLVQEERALLARLVSGQTKLRRFPSLQWSVSGKRFIRSTAPEHLEKLGLIERHVVSSKGVSIYMPTQRARALLDAAAATNENRKFIEIPPDTTGAKVQLGSADDLSECASQFSAEPSRADVAE